MREVIEGIADLGSILEIRKDWAPGIITSFIRVEGRPVGVWKTFSLNGRLLEQNDFRSINQGDLNSRGSPYAGGAPGIK